MAAAERPLTGGEMAAAVREHAGVDRLEALIRQLQGKVAAIEDPPAWTAMTLVNGWTNQFSGAGAAAYYKDASGIVRCKGLISATAPASDATFFTLPVGYRPDVGAGQYLSFPMHYWTGTQFLLGRMLAYDDGRLRGTTNADGTANRDYYSLAPISFRAA